MVVKIETSLRRGDAAIRLQQALWQIDAYLCLDGEDWAHFAKTFADDIETLHRVKNNLDMHAFLSTRNLMAALSIAETIVGCAEKTEESLSRRGLLD